VSVKSFKNITIMKKKNPVVHFELPADDRQKLASFYSDVFGWDTTFLGEEMGNYVTVKTAETDQNNMIKQPGAINGGIYVKGQGTQSNCPSLVIAVDDINEHIGKLKESGAEVLGEPADIPGIGSFVSFRDPSGNVCSILQPIMPVGQQQEVEEFGLTGEI
jgi:predicted enzyme related to lactoylglutathione lyase